MKDALFSNQGKVLKFMTREALDEMKSVFDCDVKLKLIVNTQNSRWFGIF